MSCEESPALADPHPGGVEIKIKVHLRFIPLARPAFQECDEASHPGHTAHTASTFQNVIANHLGIAA